MVLDLVPSRTIEQIEYDPGLSTDDLARALHVTPRTLARWRAGDSHPQRDARQRLMSLVELQRHLTDTFRDATAARQWLQDPNRYLGWLAPLEVLRAGRVDRVEAALVALDAGIFI